MGRHAANVTVPCPRCGALAERTHVAQSRQGVVRAHESLLCAACGLTQESDGPDLNDSARAAFYACEGRWSTMLRDPGPRRTEALGMLRSLVHATPAELKRMMDGQLPMVEGTLAEVERVTEMLGSVGVVIDSFEIESRDDPLEQQKDSVQLDQDEDDYPSRQLINVKYIP